MSSSTLQIATPRAFAPLLAPRRYKGAWGGRGSGKSHFFAELLIESALLRPGLRAVCIREVQHSLKQSVKRLLEDKIAALGVGRHFHVLENEIRTPGRGLFIFQGMQAHTADAIKSMEGCDIAWVEEAQALSQRSLRLLRPTIRKPGSEIWFSWNPENPDDPVDALLRGESALGPEMAAVVRANWRDNPWFPAELDEERRSDLTRRPEEYDHVWEGGYVAISDALVFRGKVSVEDFRTPDGVRFFHGADWGFASDPTALLRCFIAGDTLFVDAEAFGHGVEIDALPALFDRIPTSRTWPIKADAARPETISYIRRQGFNIAAAPKWPGSVEDGIAHLKGFRRIVVHPRCEQIAREFRLYSYRTDPRSGEVLPVLLDADNHGIDALRYALDGHIRPRPAARRLQLPIMAR